MKKIIGIFIILIGLASWSAAQRYAYVDTQYILENIPEYNKAQEDLNKMSEKWVKEIEDRFSVVEKKHREFEAEKILLPEEMRKQRLVEIKTLDNQVKELQKKYFGVGGDLFTQREQLIKPIQDQIFNAIQSIASERNFAFVFDKANQSNLLYADPKYDVSDQVIRKMGIKIDKNK